MKNIFKAFEEIALIGIIIAGILICVNLIFGDKSKLDPASPSHQKEITMANFKRSDFNLTAEDYVKELSREQIMRQAVYTKQTQQKKLSNKEAAKRYLIITELKELMELAQARGLQIKDLKQLVEDSEIKAQAKQGRLFNGSQFPQ